MITVANITRDGETGFLGNKMFMLANAIAVAKRVGDEVVLPPWEFQDTFSVNVRTSTTIEFNHEYQEPHFHYAPIPAVRSLNLRGYFQSEKYFEDCKETIRAWFQPSEKIKEKINTAYGPLLSKNTVGIHVRRGDYIKKYTDHHPFPGLEYYQKAIMALPEAEVYLIVSNDIPWCKKSFIGKQFVFSESPQETEQGNSSAAFDLFLLSRCRHQIICNSTFSWWASYLNLNQDKKVVAPRTWFGPAKTLEGVDPKDIYLPSWIVV